MFTLLQSITVLGRDSVTSNKLTTGLERQLMVLPGDSTVLDRVRHLLVLQLASQVISNYTELQSTVSVSYEQLKNTLDNKSEIKGRKEMNVGGIKSQSLPPRQTQRTCAETVAIAMSQLKHCSLTCVGLLINSDIYLTCKVHHAGFCELGHSVFFKVIIV